MLPEWKGGTENNSYILKLFQSIVLTQLYIEKLRYSSLTRNWKESFLLQFPHYILKELKASEHWYLFFSLWTPTYEMLTDYSATCHRFKSHIYQPRRLLLLDTEAERNNFIFASIFEIILLNSSFLQSIPPSQIHVLHILKP